MITNQKRRILMIKTSHATKEGSHASQNKEDPQESEQKFNLYGRRKLIG